MANDYERITRTELHKLQNKLNKTQEDFVEGGNNAQKELKKSLKLFSKWFCAFWD